MSRISLERPISAGIFLSYRCTSRCRHCMYACSPDWKDDWISMPQMGEFLALLAPGIAPSPLGPQSISVNHGLHFTGGEPFLNPQLLIDSVRAARELSIPSVFVETNCHWCRSDSEVRDLLNELKYAGMSGILISVNPFILEYVPFQRTERAVRLGAEIFGDNMLVYQQVFYNQFRAFGIKETLALENYLSMAPPQGLSYAEILPMGRLPYKLEGLLRTYPASQFFQASCRKELTRNWHIHIDNYGNYIPGYCGGISLGHAGILKNLPAGVETKNRKVIHALMRGLGELWQLAHTLGYEELARGYVSKCHLCVDIRKYLVAVTDEFEELTPTEFYSQL